MDSRFDLQTLVMWLHAGLRSWLSRIPNSLVGDSRGCRILRQTQIIYAGLPHVLRTGGESALANDNAWSF